MATTPILIGNVRGPQGEQGPQGEIGPQGPMGAAGTTGIRGSRLVSGSAIDGINTEELSYPTGIADSLVNDHYLNISTGNVYRCTVSGDEETAKWVWVGQFKGIKGEKGDQGIQGPGGVRGNRWLVGTDITGTFTEETVFTDSGITDAMVDDHYLNSDTGNIYKCCVGGEADTAKWALVGNIKPDFTIEVSTDTLDAWKVFGDITSYTLAHVAYGNGKFVSVGNSGTVAIYKDDAVSVSTICDCHLNAITYANGKFVAVGYSATILYSTDGITWSKADTSFINSGHTLYGITYGNGKFVAVGYGIILTSQNGLVWTTSFINETEDVESPIITDDEGNIIETEPNITCNVSFSGVAYGNGKFVAVGGLYSGTKPLFHMIYSEDGTTWSDVTNVTTEGRYAGVRYLNDKFVTWGAASLDKFIKYSYDGLEWTSASTSLTSTINDIAYGKGRYLAISRAGVISYSTDGISWSAQSSIVGDSINAFGIAYGDNDFVIAGRYCLLYSKFIRERKTPEEYIKEKHEVNKAIIDGFLYDTTDITSGKATLRWDDHFFTFTASCTLPATSVNKYIYVSFKLSDALCKMASSLANLPSPYTIYIHTRDGKVLQFGTVVYSEDDGILTFALKVITASSSGDILNMYVTLPYVDGIIE